MIHIAKPLISKAEERAVLMALRKGQLAQGEMVKKFEEAFAEYIGTKHAIAVSSGTAALHLTLLALGIKPGDEVITTPFSFIASANAILYTGAKPVFVDIDPKTFTINPSLIEEKITKHTKAILPVHLYGLPANMTKINALAKKYKLKVIEDACQAHGAAIKEKLVGALGTAGCFSFYPTKNMTTGEGGIITTNSKQLAKSLRLLRSHGMPKRYYHTHLGYNLRMTDISASIGIEQLKKLAKFNKKRIANAKLYYKHLAGLKGMALPTIPANYEHVFHQFTVRVTSKYSTSRRKLIEKLKKHQISTEVYYPIPISRQKLYQDLGYAKAFIESEVAAKEVLSLPVHPGVSKEDILKIVSLINEK